MTLEHWVFQLQPFCMAVSFCSEFPSIGMDSRLNSILLQFAVSKTEAYEASSQKREKNTMRRLQTKEERSSKTNPDF